MTKTPPRLLLHAHAAGQLDSAVALTPWRKANLLVIVIAGSMWLIARRERSLAPQALKLFDGVGTLALNVTMVVMGYSYAAVSAWGGMAGTISIFHVVLARAILVPSTARRTAVITALSFSAQVVAQALLEPSHRVAADLDNPWLRLMGPFFLALPERR